MKDRVSKTKGVMKNSQLMLYLIKASKNLTMEVREQRKIIMDLKLKLASLKTIGHDGVEVMRGCEKQRLVKANGGCHRYIEMIDFKFAGTVYEVKRN